MEPTALIVRFGNRLRKTPRVQLLTKSDSLLHLHGDKAPRTECDTPATAGSVFVREVAHSDRQIYPPWAYPVLDFALSTSQGAHYNSDVTDLLSLPTIRKRPRGVCYTRLTPSLKQREELTPPLMEGPIYVYTR